MRTGFPMTVRIPRNPTGMGQNEVSRGNGDAKGHNVAGIGNNSQRQLQCYRIKCDVLRINLHYNRAKGPLCTAFGYVHTE